MAQRGESEYRPLLQEPLKQAHRDLQSYPNSFRLFLVFLGVTPGNTREALVIPPNDKYILSAREDLTLPQGSQLKVTYSANSHHLNGRSDLHPWIEARMIAEIVRAGDSREGFRQLYIETEDGRLNNTEPNRSNLRLSADGLGGNNSSRDFLNWVTGTFYPVYNRLALGDK